MVRIVVLISGKGTNLRAIVEAQAREAWPGKVVAVISSKAGAGGLAFAAEQGIPNHVIAHQNYSNRELFDAELMAAIDGYDPDLVVLAGFMRILSAAFVEHYAGRLLNIHPSLLPAFPGLQTHRRALTEGVKIHGCTVHFVTPQVDYGPIVAQAAVPVYAQDDEAQLTARVQAAEHQLYPLVVRWFVEGRLVIADGRVQVAGAGTAGQISQSTFPWLAAGINLDA